MGGDGSSKRGSELEAGASHDEREEEGDNKTASHLAEDENEEAGREERVRDDEKETEKALVIGEGEGDDVEERNEATDDVFGVLDEMLETIGTNDEVSTRLSLSLALSRKSVQYTPIRTVYRRGGIGNGLPN